ncbi:hypothetical protein OH76DRAFT_1488845 [Lentinus brumalis]|uniref:Uncharacterized protein n=1 Tax=Lentinus brumalis TaxID=2498619 RepID=A0A371CPJ8_9APHY|nr:hypothetical protein OH76DRAFT_1488845 [Polyporus brumalis]
MNSSRTNTTPLAAGAPSMTAPQLPPRLFIPMGSVRGEAPDAHPASLRDLRHIRYGTILFGIPLAVLLSSPEDALRRKIPDYDDQTILQILFMHIHIKINWPGYEHMNFTYKIYLSERGGGGVSCKGELAKEVAKAVKKFLEKAASSTFINGLHPSFVIGSDGPFTLENLSLVAVNNAYDAVYQVHLQLIDQPTMPGTIPPDHVLQTPAGVRYSPQVPTMHTGTPSAVATLGSCNAAPPQFPSLPPGVATFQQQNSSTACSQKDLLARVGLQYIQQVSRSMQMATSLAETLGGYNPALPPGMALTRQENYSTAWIPHFLAYVQSQNALRTAPNAGPSAQWTSRQP